MEAILLHPKNKRQLSLLKSLAKEMGVSFEMKEEKKELYNPKFVADKLQAREDSKNGLGTIIKAEDLWK
jgi:hypothetical protein